jgi:hypothetical protein
MLLQEIEILINILEDTIGPTDNRTFYEKHKKKILGGAALAATILAAKNDKLPRSLQTAVDALGSAGNSIATGVTDTARQLTGHTTLGDALFSKRETIPGYLYNKYRLIKNTAF